MGGGSGLFGGGMDLGGFVVGYERVGGHVALRLCCFGEASILQCRCRVGFWFWFLGRGLGGIQEEEDYMVVLFGLG